MAGAGKKTFTAGEVLTASDVNTYLMEQSVMVFGGTAARASAIPTPSEGMTSYRTDTQQIESYDGAEWRGMSGLQLIKKQTVGSGVSSVSVTDAFNANYDNYKIILNGGVGSTAQNFLLSFTGGPANSYYEAGLIVAYPTATQTALTSSNTSSFRFAGSSSTANNQLSVELGNPFTAKVKTYFAQYGSTFAAGNAGFLSGFFDNTGSYTGFTLAVSGTLTGGTIYVYGYGK